MTVRPRRVVAVVRPRLLREDRHAGLPEHVQRGGVGGAVVVVLGCVRAVDGEPPFELADQPGRHGVGRPPQQRQHVVGVAVGVHAPI